LHGGQELAPPGTAVEEMNGEIQVPVEGINFMPKRVCVLGERHSHEHVYGEVGNDGNLSKMLQKCFVGRSGMRTQAMADASLSWFLLEKIGMWRDTWLENRELITGLWRAFG
jgi:hypothetical protein